MPKQKSKYVCSACGDSFTAWSGKCTTCGEWNTIQQLLDVQSSTRADQAVKSGQLLKSEKLNINTTQKEYARFTTTISDVDVVLGGGVVPGSVTLLAGQPGIGNSTILWQIAYGLGANAKVLYVSGEESVDQVSLRGKRLHNSDNTVMIPTSNSANDIAATIASDV